MNALEFTRDYQKRIPFIQHLRIQTDELEQLAVDLVAGQGCRRITLTERLGEQGTQGVVRPLTDELQAELMGLGVLEPLVADEGVTDVLVNGDGSVWVDRGAGVTRAVGVEVGDHADGVREPGAGAEGGAALVVDEDEGQLVRPVGQRQRGDERLQQLALAGAGRPDDRDERREEPEARVRDVEPEPRPDEGASQRHRQSRVRR